MVAGKETEFKRKTTHPHTMQTDKRGTHSGVVKSRNAYLMPNRCAIGDKWGVMTVSTSAGSVCKSKD